MINLRPYTLKDCNDALREYDEISQTFYELVKSAAELIVPVDDTPISQYMTSVFRGVLMKLVWDAHVENGQQIKGFRVRALERELEQAKSVLRPK